MSKSYYSLGLMSGTSGDGVDSSILQSDGDTEYKVILDKYFKYNQDIYENIHSLKNKINVSVDLKDFKPIKGLVLIKKNIFDKDFIFVLKKYFLEDIDIVISDAAPSTTGNKFVDHIKIVELCERSYEIAINLLNKGGILVIKIFDGKETSKICQIIKKRFLNFNLYKPKSSKSESKEIYIIAKFLK